MSLCPFFENFSTVLCEHCRCYGLIVFVNFEDFLPPLFRFFERWGTELWLGWTAIGFRAVVIFLFLEYVTLGVDLFGERRDAVIIYIIKVERLLVRNQQFLGRLLLLPLLFHFYCLYCLLYGGTSRFLLALLFCVGLVIISGHHLCLI